MKYLPAEPWIRPCVFAVEEKNRIPLNVSEIQRKDKRLNTRDALSNTRFWGFIAKHVAIY